MSFNKKSASKPGPSNIQSLSLPGETSAYPNSFFSVHGDKTKINIPASVTNIEKDMLDLFEDGFGKITEITVDPNNEHFSSDGSGVLFNKDKTELIRFLRGSALTSYTIPDGVTRIGLKAFEGCSNLESISIPDSVTSIGDYAFARCKFLSNLKIQNGVKEIGNRAFINCVNLTEIMIPDSVISIGAAAFAGCTGLTSITLPDGVTGIGNSAFMGCSSLTVIKIPDSVTGIGNAAFRNCEKLIDVKLPDSLKDIGYAVFFACSGLTNVTIPDGVTDIGPYAFAACSGLESVTIPGSVTSIGPMAFGGCTNLKGVIIPESVTVIDESAFLYCPGMSDKQIMPIEQAVEQFRNARGALPVSCRGDSDYLFFACFPEDYGFPDYYKYWASLSIKDGKLFLEVSDYPHDRGATPSIEIEISASRFYGIILEGFPEEKYDYLRAFKTEKDWEKLFNG